MKSVSLSILLGSVLAVLTSVATAADASAAKAADVIVLKKPLAEPANPKLPSLILVGDSTVRNGQDDGQDKGPEGQWGWGHLLADYFDPTKINVVNRAVGGLSSRTYYTRFWTETLAWVKAGDFVMIQLGTNDGAPLNDAARARGTIKGVGNETEEIDNLLTKQHEVVHTYGWYLRQLVAETRAKGATPILCSLVPRKTWGEDGRINRHKTSYAGWAETVAREEKVPFIDLNELIARQYDALGHDAVMKLFPQVTPDEHTHTNWAGADLTAQVVVREISAIEPLRQSLSPRGAALVAR
jgi:lysophospholipase L1-like esterase